MRVAVLGMGGLGRSLAERARRYGHDVLVWNRTPGKAGEFTAAASAAAAVDHANAVLVVVRDDAAVRQVCSTEVLDRLGPDAYLLIVTTVAPELVRDLARCRPGRVLDIPVIGSPDMIRQGRAAMLVGGAESATPALVGLLDDLCPARTRCGPVGGATVMKIVSNCQLVLGVAALAEGVAAARTNGVGDDVLRAVFGESIMISEGARMGLSAMLDPDHEGVLGPVDNAVNDINRMLALAPDQRPVLTPAALDLLARVAEPDWPDFSAVVEGVP